MIQNKLKNILFFISVLDFIRTYVVLWEISREITTEEYQTIKNFM